MAVSKLGAAAVPINLILLGAALSQARRLGVGLGLEVRVGLGSGAGAGPGVGVGVGVRGSHSHLRLRARCASNISQLHLDHISTISQPISTISQGPLRGELPRLNCFGVVLARLVLMPLGGLAVARALAARINVPAEVADPSLTL